MLKSKFGAQKIYIDGIRFDSRTEGEFYRECKRNPDIEILGVHPKIYMTKARILYIADFKLRENGVDYYVDVKGMITSVFAIKFRLWKFYGDGLLKIVMKNKKGFFVDKETECKNQS